MMGCGSEGTGQDTAGYEDTNHDAHSDTPITVIDFVLSSALDKNGQPANISSVFHSDTGEVYFTFWLSADLCCTRLIARWFCNDEIVSDWVEEGPNLSYPYTVSISKPEIGFAKGDYKVVIYIGITEILSVPFAVE
jgi:hypothetical protein